MFTNDSDLQELLALNQVRPQADQSTTRTTILKGSSTKEILSHKSHILDNNEVWSYLILVGVLLEYQCNKKQLKYLKPLIQLNATHSTQTLICQLNATLHTTNGIHP